MMHKVASEPAVIDLKRVYLDTAQQRFNTALADIPDELHSQVAELSYLAYEALARGKFGSGCFDIAITCSEDEFVVGVKKEA